MALITGQAVLGTAPTTILYLPGGSCVVTLTSDTASTSTAYIGAGTSVTTANGVPLVPGGSLPWAAYPGSKGSAVSAVTTGSSAATIGWVVSTDG